MKHMKERNLEMLTLFVEEHKTLQEIGNKFGVSREAVRQVLNRELLPWQYQELLKDNLIKRHKPVEKFYCKCGGEKSRISKECMNCHIKNVKKYYTLEEKRKGHAQHMKRYRLNNLEKWRARSRAYFLKHRKNESK